jgi:hypothetical protein
MRTAPRDGVFAPSTNDSKRMVWKVIRSLKFLSQFALVALPLSSSSGLAKAQTAYEASFLCRSRLTGESQFCQLEITRSLCLV